MSRRRHFLPLKLTAILVAGWLVGTYLTVPIQAQLTTSLIEYWKLDEASGNRAGAFAAKTLTDVEAVGSATGLVYPLAADFITGTNEQLERADEAGLSHGNIAYTWAAWVFLDAKGSDRNITCKCVSGSPNHSESSLGFFNTPDRFYFNAASGSDFANQTNVQATTFGSPSLSTWYLIIGWHDPTADTLNISVNNGATNSTAYTFGSYDSPAPFVVGRANNFGNLWDGRIGPLMRWNKVLTSDERTALYNNGNGLRFESFTGAGSLNLFGIGR